MISWFALNWCSQVSVQFVIFVHFSSISSFVDFVKRAKSDHIKSDSILIYLSSWTIWWRYVTYYLKLVTCCLKSLYDLKSAIWICPILWIIVIWFRKLCDFDSSLDLWRSFVWCHLSLICYVIWSLVTYIRYMYCYSTCCFDPWFMCEFVCTFDAIGWF